MIAGAMSLSFFSWPAFGQDADRGKALYETHCGGCHYERVHQRPRERSLVNSLAALRVEVARRAGQTSVPFTVTDLDDIAAYLDRSHYRFDK
jgi:mono/diheme cytochrome c family protein